MTAAEVDHQPAGLRELVETLPLVVYTAPLAENDALPRFVSPSVEEILGIATSDFTFDRLRADVHPDDRERVLAAYDEADGAQEDLTIDYRFVRPDGRIVWIEDTSRVVHVDGEALAQGYLLDVTRRKRTEAALTRGAEVQHRLSIVMRRSLEGAPRDEVIGGVLSLLEDELGAEVGAFFEPAGNDLVATRVFGWSSQVEGSTAHPDTPVEHAFRRRMTFAGETVAPPDADFGKLGLRSSIAAPILNAADACVGVLAVHSREREAFGPSEVTLVEHVAEVVAAVIERDTLDARLRAAHRLESVGQLAAGVAHDFNNMLTVIAGHAGFAFRHTAPAGTTHLQHVLDAAERARTLTAQLLAFSRKQVLQPRAVRLDTVAEDLRPMLQTLIGASIALQITGQPVTVLTDEAQLENVVVNLAANARDAMPDGGALRISTCERVVPAADALLHDVEPGRYGVIVVTDTGTGMSPAVLERIFEPFFTTKEHGAGTGLGLAGAYGMVRQSGGFVTVVSTPGAGSEFAIHLPLTEPVTHDGALPTLPAVSVRSARVLVVEDEPVVRDVVAAQLEEMGHEVHSVTTGQEALAALQEQSFHVVVSDVGLPGMDGVGLAAAIRRAHPGVKLVLVSGYPGDYLDARHQTAGVPLLQKPFTAAELEAVLADVLA